MDPASKSYRLAFAFAAVPLVQGLAMYFRFPLFWDFVGHEGQADPAGARVLVVLADDLSPIGALTPRRFIELRRRMSEEELLR